MHFLYVMPLYLNFLMKYWDLLQKALPAYKNQDSLHFLVLLLRKSNESEIN